MEKKFDAKTVLFVIVFAGAIVALGAKEIHRRFAERGREGVPAKQLLADMNDDAEHSRARLRTDPQDEDEEFSLDRDSLQKMLDKVIP